MLAVTLYTSITTGYLYANGVLNILIKHMNGMKYPHVKLLQVKYILYTRPVPNRGKLRSRIIAESVCIHVNG